MTLYSLALFAHIIGVLGLFIAIGVESMSMIFLRRARTVAQVREWAGATTAMDKVHPVATLLILGGGLYMTVAVWGWSTAWIDLSLLVVLALSVLGPLVNGRRFRAIHAAAEAAPAGSVPAELARRIEDPVLWTSLCTMSGIAVGIVALMTFKPALGGTVVILAVAGALGLALSRGAGRTRAAASMAEQKAG